VGVAIAAWQGFLFILGSAGLLALSWGSLRARAHGFYRFFAFEGILALVALNLPVWFHEPFRLAQILSWLLLLASIGLALHGFWLLKQMGKPDQAIADPARIGFEKTTRLVIVGAYRWIRHPLYSSLLCGGWGAFFKRPGWLGLGLALLVSAMLYLTARAEERENLRNFGAEYAEYMRRTKRFLPGLF
jgi:protein-S-isoprenylcysteine O-methyltransferase Ste14